MDIYEKIIIVPFDIENKVVIKPGDTYLDEYGNAKIKNIDTNGNIEYLTNNTNTDVIVNVYIDPREFTIEQSNLLNEKFIELQNKVDDYKAKLDIYKQDGGEKPIAEQDVMDIVELYDCKFRIKFIKE